MQRTVVEGSFEAEDHVGVEVELRGGGAVGGEIDGGVVPDAGGVGGQRAAGESDGAGEGSDGGDRDGGGFVVLGLDGECGVGDRERVS